MYRILASALTLSFALSLGSPAYATVTSFKGYKNAAGVAECRPLNSNMQIIWEMGVSDSRWCDLTGNLPPLPARSGATPAAPAPAAPTPGYKIWQASTGQECWVYNYTTNTWGSKATLDKCGITAPAVAQPVPAQTLKGYEVWGGNQCWERFTDNSWGKQVDFAKCQSAIPVKTTYQIINGKQCIETISQGMSNLSTKVVGNEKCNLTIRYVKEGNLCRELYSSGVYGANVGLDKCPASTTPAPATPAPATPAPVTPKPAASTPGYKIFQTSTGGQECWVYNYTTNRWGSKATLDKCNIPETWKFVTSGNTCLRQSNYGKSETADLSKCGITRLYVPQNDNKECFEKYYPSNTLGNKVELSKCGIRIAYEFNWSSKECFESYRHVNSATGGVRGDKVELSKCDMRIDYESAAGGTQCWEKYMPRGERGTLVDQSKCTPVITYRANGFGNKCLQYTNSEYVGEASLDKCNITVKYVTRNNECVEQYTPSLTLGNTVSASLCGTSVPKTWKYVESGTACLYQSNYGESETIAATDRRYVNCPNLFKPTLTAKVTGTTCVVHDQFGNSGNPKTGVAYPKTSCPETVVWPNPKEEKASFYRFYTQNPVGCYKMNVNDRNEATKGGKVELSKCNITLSYSLDVSNPSTSGCYETYSNGFRGDKVELSKCNTRVTYELQPSGYCREKYMPSSQYGAAVSVELCGVITSSDRLERSSSGGVQCVRRYSNGKFTVMDLSQCPFAYSGDVQDLLNTDYRIKDGIMCEKVISEKASGKVISRSSADISQCGISITHKSKTGKDCFKQYLPSKIFGQAAAISECGITIKNETKTGKDCFEKYNSPDFPNVFGNALSLSACNITKSYRANGDQCVAVYSPGNITENVASSYCPAPSNPGNPGNPDNNPSTCPQIRSALADAKLIQSNINQSISDNQTRLQACESLLPIAIEYERNYPGQQFDPVSAAGLASQCLGYTTNVRAYTVSGYIGNFRHQLSELGREKLAMDSKVELLQRSVELCH